MSERRPRRRLAALVESLGARGAGLRERLQRLGAGGALALIALGVGLVALAALAVGAGLALALVLPAWLAALLVGLTLLGLAAGLLVAARRRTRPAERPSPPAPRAEELLGTILAEADLPAADLLIPSLVLGLVAGARRGRGSRRRAS